jgi:hypothetical protein
LVETGEILAPFYMIALFENEKNETLIRIRKFAFSSEYIQKFLKPFDNGYLNIFNNQFYKDDTLKSFIRYLE